MASNVRRRASVGSREGRATRVKIQAGDERGRAPSRDDPGGPADLGWDPKLFGEVRKHGLTGPLGFDERLKG